MRQQASEELSALAKRQALARERKKTTMEELLAAHAAIIEPYTDWLLSAQGRMQLRGINLSGKHVSLSLDAVYALLCSTIELNSCSVT